MKRARRCRLLQAAGITALLLALPASGAGEGDPPLIEKVRVETGVEGKVGIFFQLNGFFVPACFGIAGDFPRFVCDFAGARLAEGVETEIRAAGPILSRIRFGSHGEPDRKVRVVLDLEPAEGFDIQQLFVEETDEYVLIVQPE